MISLEEYIRAVTDCGELLADELYIYVNKDNLFAAVLHKSEDFPMDVMDIARKMEKDPEHPLWTELYEDYKERCI